MAFVDRDITYPRYREYSDSGSALHRDYGPVQLTCAANTNVALALESLYAFPFLSGRGGAFDVMEFYLANGGTNPATDAIARVGIGVYENTSDSDLRPAALVAQLMDISLQLSGARSASISLTLEPNKLYWIAYAATATVPVIGTHGDLTIDALAPDPETGAPTSLLDRETGSWYDDLEVTAASPYFPGAIVLRGFNNAGNNVDLDDGGTVVNAKRLKLGVISGLVDETSASASATLGTGPLTPSIKGQNRESAWAILGDSGSTDSTTPAGGWSVAHEFDGSLPDPFPTATPYIPTSGIPGIRLRQTTLADEPGVASRYKPLEFWRQKGDDVVRYYGTQITCFTRVTGAAFALNTAFAAPHYSGAGGVVDSIQCYVTNAGAGTGKIRLAIYESRAFDPIPGRLVAESGELAMSSIGFKTATISATLRPRRIYWLCALAGTATATLRYESPDGHFPYFGDDGALSNARPLCAYTASYTYGPWPATFPSGSLTCPNGSNSPPIPSVRVHYAS